MRVNPALVKDRKNSGFSKKPGKRRLARSTQFSRNRILEDSSPRMTPSHQRSQDLISVRRRNDQSIKLTPALSTTFARPAEKGDTHFIQNPRTEKDHPQQGTRNIGLPFPPVKRFRGKWRKANRFKGLDAIAVAQISVHFFASRNKAPTGLAAGAPRQLSAFPGGRRRLKASALSEEGPLAHRRPPEAPHRRTRTEHARS